VTGEKLGALGFSMGAAFARLLDSLHPDAFDRIVLFYGTTDIAGSKAQFQGHFGEEDEWEPLDGVQAMEGPNFELHLYPGVGHWFVEEDRPDHYNAEAARTAWNRMVSFFSRE
jgi:carboxymethylenebutenolidase